MRIQTVYERERRIHKALAILDWLVCVEARPENVSELTESEWSLIAQAAGVRMPSAETRALVLQHLNSMKGDGAHD